VKGLVPLDRRRVLTSLVATLVSAQARGAPKDNGLGGTGYISVAPGPDNGLGGTGVVGTIRGFGSIFVNGLEISYAPDVEVTLDGEPATAARMRIGHVVSLVAEHDQTGFAASRIRILREVVGPIDSLSGRRLRIAGQTVELGHGVAASGLARGRRVAVSGLRLPDQTIIASLVEPAEPGAVQIVGMVARDAQGQMTIGSQRLSGVARSLVGQRVALRGEMVGHDLDVSFVSPDATTPRDVRRAFVETYVESEGATVFTAAGQRFTPSRAATFQGVARAVIGVDVDLDGGMTIDSIRASDRLGDKGSGKALRERMRDAPEPEPPATSPGGGDSGAQAAPGVDGQPAFGAGTPGSGGMSLPGGGGFRGPGPGPGMPGPGPGPGLGPGSGPPRR